MNRECLSTAGAPAAVGPYSQAVRAGETVYLSGQIGLVPETGKMVDGDVSAQAGQALKNLSAVLAAAGLGTEHVVKTVVFITDMAHFPAVNEVYKTFFQAPYPARSCVAVSALPMGALVEVEAIAVR
ncbi:RidA family protein [uncultured Desulfovibrio sp.]|uniref:RidA family protein n=1 Tax=uncultured Desulfovibrio sp. TaxID=167968 RepID=UPI00261AC336|nr:RidA family protein [uncultured Desulfovibrio sp.]